MERRINFENPFNEMERRINFENPFTYGDIHFIDYTLITNLMH